MKFLTDPVIKVIKGMLIVCMAIFLFLQIKQPSNSKAEFQDVVLAAIQDKDMSGYTQVDNLAIKRFLALNPDDFENIIKT
ncbi:MAG: hypothetical protein HUJ53_04775, partial [Holdemanella sp.]|nr:hypothetical protein [Holdemanella sp.]